MSHATRAFLFVGASCLVIGSGQAMAQSSPSGASAGVSGQGLGPASTQPLAGQTAPQTPLQGNPTSGSVGQTPTTLGEVIVTANKREQAVNTVPLTISAVSGDQLAKAGVSNANDLTKVVPGFTYTNADYDTPVYSIRGIGFYNVSLGTKSTVSLYNDEEPIPFAKLSAGSALDLNRVEVLKGPQGILFGENSTGGAVNFIAAKPTQTFQAGADLDYGRFNAVNVGGFVSGPITDTLTGRVAFRTEQADPWQESYTQDLKLGRRNFTTFRALLDWKPNSRFKAEINLNGFLNKSDTQAAQYIALVPGVNPLPHLPGLVNYPTAPANDRAADWTAGMPLREDAKYFQPSLRLDYVLNDSVTLTALTSYNSYSNLQNVDPDGVSLQNLSDLGRTRVTSFNEEVRAAGRIQRLNYIVGANYEHSAVNDTDLTQVGQSTGAFALVDAFGPAAQALGIAPTPDVGEINNEKFETSAVFTNLDYDITDALTVHGGIRYTRTDLAYNACTFSPQDNIFGQDLTVVTDLIRASAGLPPITPIGPGQCATLGPTLTPELVTGVLRQNNVSWRVGLDWKPFDRTLLYVSVSKGYKAGSLPTVAATSYAQLQPVTQESVIDYEGGFKVALLQRTVQLNGAVFYYDYTNKQFQGDIITTPNLFGALSTLLNIPKSDVIGGEISLDWRPIKGLTTSIAGTFTKTSIGDFTTLDPLGVPGNLKGNAFPYTPVAQIVDSAEYDFQINTTLDGFVGGNVSYQSRTNASLQSDPLFTIAPYGLVDLRAGVNTDDGRYRLTVWGRNIGDTYYWNNVSRISDTVVRFAGYPASYGVSLSYRFR